MADQAHREACPDRPDDVDPDTGPDVCSWDTGSMTGCEPACWSPPVAVIVYDGYRGPYRAPVCARHQRPTLARIQPATYRVEEIR